MIEKPLILLTNDDGIDSPGLAAAAAALDPLGELLIVAPNAQQTSMSRSKSQQAGNDGRLFKRQVQFENQSWTGVAANATPALAVFHGVFELAQREINLVVSGFNHGENVGSCVTVSGTVGAAMEAADLGYPALAASLEIDPTVKNKHAHFPDFTAAIHFLRLAARYALGNEYPPDVDLLKVDIPHGATVDSKWLVTVQDKLMYYKEFIQPRENPFKGAGPIWAAPSKGQYLGSERATDAYALAQGWVAVTPLSLDLTSRTDLSLLERGLRADK